MTASACPPVGGAQGGGDARVERAAAVYAKCHADMLVAFERDGVTSAPIAEVVTLLLDKAGLQGDLIGVITQRDDALARVRALEAAEARVREVADERQNRAAAYRAASAGRGMTVGQQWELRQNADALDRDAAEILAALDGTDAS